MPGDLPDWTSRMAIGMEPIATLTIAAGATLASAQLTPPAATSGLMIMLVPTGFPGTVILGGGLTGFNYLEITNVGAEEGGPVPVWIPADADAPYDLALLYSGGTGTMPAQTVAIVYAFLGGGFTGVVGSPFAPLPVQGVGGGGGDLLPVFKAPPQFCKPIGVFGSTTTIIPGVANQSIRLRRVVFQGYSVPSSADYGQFQDTVGGNVWYFNLVTAGPFEMDYEGLALPVGAGWECVQQNGSVTLNGVVTFDQD